tara:strand:- start:2680 stop:2829 length:150 start_codon:yes stop_codon:yes gene_type:complete
MEIVVGYKIEIDIPFFSGTITIINSIIHPINIIMMGHDGILITIFRNYK